MRGRILSIKKTTILKLSFVLNLLLFVVMSILSFVVIKNNDLWFFMFCIFIGLHLIIKSMLFKFDSSCYFGSLLLSIGLMYVYCILLNITNFYPTFLIMSFAFASFITGFFFKQTFHYLLFFSLIFVSLDLLFYSINFISIWIFLAILSLIVILLICKYLIIRTGE